ncbi:hypothetical protein HHK36_001871 [Tetracentron sinense]|uniref:E2 ubiquitin-conjugating enzyme n=1 Tax=Tetracentron sinense TaxID=13715 RepID=A0A834ZWV0_TETSI|nr:hypothetical protein HHK36_001871 [Tetracentron sinense]
MKALVSRIFHGVFLLLNAAQLLTSLHPDRCVITACIPSLPLSIGDSGIVLFSLTTSTNELGECFFDLGWRFATEVKNPNCSNMGFKRNGSSFSGPCPIRDGLVPDFGSWVYPHDVIDIDGDEDSAGVHIIGEKADTGNKGKTKQGYGKNWQKQVKDALANDRMVPTSAAYLGSMDGFHPIKSFAPGAHNLINLDGFSCELSYYDNEDDGGGDADDVYDFHYDDLMPDDFYSSLQSQFDNVDLPSGVEAPVPWFQDPVVSKKKPAATSSSTYSSLKTKFDAMEPPLGVGLPSISRLQDFGRSKKKPATTSSSTHLYLQTQVDSVDLLPGVGSPISWLQNFEESKKNPAATSSSTFPWLQTLFNPVHLPLGLEAPIPWVQDSPPCQKKPTVTNSSTVPIESSSSWMKEDEAMEKFILFKRFDTVQDYSDHHYTRERFSVKQPSKNWAKKIQEEWKILENDLPETIFVRVYEARMDLLRAVIVGAAGTPYHDGIFFFDVFFPFDYPNVPPKVYYHSGGLRLNPNLYNCGKVCLSLLNTWNGNKNEKWIPGQSTMLQVLVSIQALILNAKPFFNEPGFVSMDGTAEGENKSRQYNESTFILSLQTMLYTLRRPPKNFEIFVLGYFREHAHDILVACKAYMEGAQVGCLVKGGVQDVDEGDKSCSKSFKESVAKMVNMLVPAFTKNGVKGCKQFLPPAVNSSNRADTALKL